MSPCHARTHAGQYLEPKKKKKSGKSAEQREASVSVLACAWTALSALSLLPTTTTTTRIRGQRRGLPESPPWGRREGSLPGGGAPARNFTQATFSTEVRPRSVTYLARSPAEPEDMFCRNQTARATVARGSALEMEIRRGKFRRSVFQDTSQVDADGPPG